MAIHNDLVSIGTWWAIHTFLSSSIGTGGPGQLPHLAPTYAAVLALCSLGAPEAYEVIDRPALQAFLLRMHQNDGSYVMHQDGEKDIRLVF